MQIPVVTIIAKSGSGKTTLLVKLISEFKRREYKLATIKRHSHAGFDIDKPGKDSWRFAQAGSDHVIIAAPDKIAGYRLLERELTLDEILEPIRDVDLILVEGFKHAGKPTIEIIRAEIGTQLIADDEQLIAVITDTPLSINVPQFANKNISEITDFIETQYLKSKTT